MNLCVWQSDVSSVIKDEVSCHLSQTPVGLQIIMLKLLGNRS